MLHIYIVAADCEPEISVPRGHKMVTAQAQPDIKSKRGSTTANYLRFRANDYGSALFSSTIYAAPDCLEKPNKIIERPSKAGAGKANDERLSKIEEALASLAKMAGKLAEQSKK